jgi:hypothetical protein
MKGSFGILAWTSILRLQPKLAYPNVAGSGSIVPRRLDFVVKSSAYHNQIGINAGDLERDFMDKYVGSIRVVFNKTKALFSFP